MNILKTIKTTALLLVALLTTSTAWAQNVAKIDATEYATLQEAFNAATAGQTVQLIADVKLANWLNVSCSDVTLDLNGHTIAPTDDHQKTNYCIILVHRGAKFTVDDSSNGKTGCIDGGTGANAYYGGILLTKNDDSGTAPATLVVNNGTIKGDQAAVTGNGNRHNTNVTINGGTLTATSTIAGSEGCAIYHPQNGTLTINGGTFTGYASAVEMRSGTLNITAGTFTATASEYSCNANGNGTTTIGAAIAIAQHTTQKDINVTISGGTFNGVKAVSEANPQGNSTPQVEMAITGGTFSGDIIATDVTNFVSGGTFSTEVSADYCAPGFEPLADGEGHYIVGHYVALIGANKYETLAEAITAATDGQTVTILSNIELTAAVTVEIEKNITIDLNGFTVSGNKLTNKGTLVVKSSVEGGKMIRNANGSVITNNAGANLTIESGTLELLYDTKTAGTINNSGTLIISGGQFNAINYAVRISGNSAVTTIAGGTFSSSSNNVVYIGDGKCEIIYGTLTSADGFDNVYLSSGGLKAPETITSNAVTTLSDEYSYTLAGALKAANAGETITLNKDADISTAATSTKDVTLSLNGHKVLSTTTAITVTSGTLTINGEGLVKGAKANAQGSKFAFYPAVYANGGNIVINSGTYDDGGVDGNGFPTIYADKTSTVTINNGTFKNSATSQGDKYWVLNTKDGSSASIVVYGGVFYNFDPANNVNDGNSGSGTDYLASGYITEMTESGPDKIYTVKEGQWLATITDTNIDRFRFTSLDDAINAAKTVANDITIQLLADAIATEELPANVTIDANSKALTLPTFNVADGSAVSYAKVINATDNTYTVTTATYNRTGAAGTQWGTACLPFSFETAPTGYTLYTPTSVSAETLTVNEVSYPVAAGTPVIFYKNNTDEVTVSSTSAKVKINATPVAQSGDIHLVGTFAGDKITEGLGNIYYINGNKFHQAKASLTVPAYRAYIYYYNTAGAKPATLLISTGEETTAIDVHSAETLGTVAAYYDINGSKLSSPKANGITILRLSNGKTIKIAK